MNTVELYSIEKPTIASTPALFPIFDATYSLVYTERTWEPGDDTNLV